MSAKTDAPNPKDLIGVTKVPTIGVIPTTALIHMGRAMQNGSVKYGPFNWRDHPVQASIYVDAAMRHLMAWWDGEENAADSGVHHLGHAMACFGILLDAQAVGNLIDDRPSPGPSPALLQQFERRPTRNTGTKPARPRTGCDGHGNPVSMSPGAQRIRSFHNTGGGS